ncbi:MAG: RNA-binding protein [Lachnospiraceae bacterium]|jgi:ribosomal protein L14E/L6E/L27E|nr:RNA-binding protein [Lachnospiraceae bacterium]
MEFECGQIVFSKCGRDKGLPFMIIKIEGEYLYLCDGSLRKIEKPKKKKIKHVQRTKCVDSEIAKSLKEGKAILDSDIRKSIAAMS